MPEAPTPQKVEQLLCEELKANAPGEIVTPETTLASLGVDSLKLVSLILVIEQKFGVNLLKVGMQPPDMVSVRSLAAAVIAGASKELPGS